MPLNSTKGRKNRAKRADQNQLFKRTLNLLSDAVLLLDRRHKIIFINSRAPKLLGIPRQGMLGKPLERILRLEDPSTRHGLPKPPNVSSGPVQLLATIGDTLFNLTAIDIHRTAGFNQLKSKAVTGLFIRPSDLAVASSSNIHQQILGKITMRIAHDFNNSLTSMLGNAELVQESLEVINSQENNDPDTPAGQAISINSDVVRKCVEMAATIRKLQGYAQPQPSAKHNIDLNAAINETFPISQRILGSRLSLEFNAGDDLPPINADHAQLQQLLFAIFDSCKERAGSGHAIVSVATTTETLGETYTSSHPGSRPGLHLKLLIADRGEPLPSEFLSKPAAVFTQNKDARPQLSLGMLYAIVKQLGAYIHIDSTAEQGTKFSIYFPINLVSEVTLPSSKKNRPGLRPRRSLKQNGSKNQLILIAEDQPDIQQTMTRALSKAGYRTNVVSSGLDALHRFQELSSDGHKPSLVIADLGLPGIDGRTLCKRVKTINPRMPVLLTSGHAIALDHSQTRTTDGIPFIKKPFDNETLLKMISELLTD